MNVTIPFYAQSGLFKRWQLHQGAQGCRRVDVPGACLKLDRAPPRVPGIPETPTRTTSAPAVQQKAPFKLLTDLVAAAQYLNTPAPPKLKSSAPPPAITGSNAEPASNYPVFPFDIYDIPTAMDRIGWPKSASLMRQFFAGRLNFSRTPRDEGRGIDQTGAYYAPEFVDSKRFTWQWLLEYPAVSNGLKTLLQPGYIDSRAGLNSAYANMGAAVKASVAGKYRTFMGPIDALADCHGDVFALHRQFQFQYFALSIRSFPNSDLGGALGNFSIYAAVAHATVERHNFAPDTVTVTHIYAYIKDNYSFTDQPHEASQYLGHWNKQGVIFVPSAPAFDFLANRVLPEFGRGIAELNMPMLRADPSSVWFDGADFTVQTGEHYSAENIFYPVRNRHFWDWQKQHQQGGNILSFSDLKLVRLAQPLSFILDKP